MVLVDTSVWIDHFRKNNTALKRLLDEERVLIHPMIIGELACGNLHNRVEILSLLAALPLSEVISDHEVLDFITQKKLHGKGLGWVDIHLLASALITNADLYTLDLSLKRACKQLKVSQS